MRAKVVLYSLAAGMAMLLLASWLSHLSPPAVPDRADVPVAAPQIGAAIAAASGPDSTVEQTSPIGARRANSENAAGDALPDGYEDYVLRRTAELQALAMTEGGESLKGILAELYNQDARIRRAALEAAIQFGSDRALPELREALAQTEDPQEKVNFQKAIDFLALPSFSELADADARTAEPQSPSP